MPPTIDQSLEMSAVDTPCISPDGNSIVYQKSRTNWRSNAFESDLWIASQTGLWVSHRLTSRVGAAEHASWFPDGRWIGFLSNRTKGIKQLFVVDPKGKEIQLTHGDAGMSLLCCCMATRSGWTRHT